MEQKEKYETLTEVRVSKEKLTETLKKNLEKHNEVFEESKKAYKQLCRNAIKDSECNYWRGYRKLKKVASGEFERMFSCLSDGKDFSITVSETVKWKKQEIPPKPKSYADEYEKIIKWLEFSDEDSIVLSSDEFDKFVMDKWEFKKTIRRESEFYLKSSDMISGCNTGVWAQSFY